MFTGIIAATGTVAASEERQGDMVLRIAAPGMDLRGIKVGDSIAVSGVCLTAVALNGDEFTADVSAETLGLTTLGTLVVGDTVNLEAALMAGDALGGHLVSGHVDERAVLVSRTPDARSERFEFEVSEQLSRYIARKGSVCIDGVSLTVNNVNDRQLGVNLIPHTMASTTLGQLECGDCVNIEADMLARYVERITGNGSD